MKFKEWLVSEQGTKFSMNGFGAGGRAGQSQSSPEMGVTNPPSINDKSNSQKIPASKFNVSSKGKGTNIIQFGPLNAGGIKNLTSPPPSSFSPSTFGSNQLQQFKN